MKITTMYAKIFVTVLLAWSWLAPCSGYAAGTAIDEGLSADQVLQMALQVNPRVRAARARWYSASHTILQNYAPADPLFQFLNVDSPKNPFAGPSEQSFVVTQNLLFPGKGYLQGQNASRNAQIARLTYDAAMRDVRAQALTGFYQVLLDEAVLDIAAQDITNLEQVLRVVQVAYSASRVTQADYIGATLNLTMARNGRRQLEVTLANDKSALNQVLDRRPEEPVNLTGKLEAIALAARLDSLIELAASRRQEVLQTALAERNAETALTLAKLEYAPDYSLSYEFDHFTTPSAAPNVTLLQDHTFAIGINVPIFFWIKQREDNTRAGFDLAAAREDLTSIRNQTATEVVMLYRQIQFSNETANLYHTTVIPLSRQAFQVAMVAYTNGKVDFITMMQAFAQYRTARITYLQSINQSLAGIFSLEQATGGALLK